MSTIHNIVERVFRQYLNRADDRQLEVRVNGAVTDSATSIALHLSELAPEEQALIGVATILENHKELIRVTSVDDATSTATVTRGDSNTTAEAISNDSLLRVSPPFNRQDVYNAVSDSVRELWPDLFGVQSELVYLEQGVNELRTAGVAGILDVQFVSTGEPVSVMEVRSDEIAESGFGFVVPNWQSDWINQDAVVRCKVRAIRPTLCTDTLASLYIDDDWVEILTISAVAKMIPGREMDRTTIEYLTEALEAQGIQIGEQFNLAASMLSLRENLIEKQQRGLLVDEEMRVEYNRVI